MTKNQYYYINSRNKSDITVKEAKAAGFKSMKAAKEAKTEIAEKREYRAELKAELRYIAEASVIAKYAKRRARSVLNMTSVYPSHSTVDAVVGDSFNVRYCTVKDFDMYSKRYGHAGTIHCYKVTVPKTGIRFIDTDGLYMAYDTVTIRHGMTIMHGWINVGRGCRVELKEVYYVHNGVYGAHGTTISEAISELKKKKAARLRASARSKVVYIKSLDSKISASMYQKITGACNEGTNAWLSRHGYKRSDRITVRELLSKLRKTDYGYSTFRDYLTKLGIELD